MINYTHSANAHSVTGARAALAVLFHERIPKSLLDVGCGTGTWLRAANELGVEEIFGVDGVAIPSTDLLIPQKCFQQVDLSQPLQIAGEFDTALCLEVAEHLSAENAETLIRSIASHSKFVLFSAAIPGQPGDHHLNGQWPAYWQRLFNAVGFVCTDEFRWKIWDRQDIEVWYRQNIFVARRDPAQAGAEPRLCAAIHPEMMPLLVYDLDTLSNHRALIEAGALPMSWYLKTPFTSFGAKLRRQFIRK